MPEQTASIGRQFLHWYIAERPVEILRNYQKYAAAFGSMFSLVFLGKTLFAPWKSIQDAYPTRGFQLQNILETFTLNMTARAIGCIIRLGAIVTGIVLQIILLAGTMAYFILWIFFPLIVPAIVIFLFRTLL